MMREGTSWWTSWRTRQWTQSITQRESSRPLLTGPDQHADEESIDQEAQQQQQQHSGYGATAENNGAGPRVEPSPIHEPNAWREQ